MSTVQSILAITDFSLGARHAVERSVRLADELGISRVGVLHVLERGLMDGLRQLFGGASDLPESFDVGARQTLERLLREVDAPAGVELEALLRSGRPLTAVLAAAEEYDMLVVGARGQTKRQRLALGTTSRALLRAHPEPVLVVRESPTGPYRRVLVAIDFSAYSETALAWARTLAPSAALNLVHVFDNPSPRSASYVRVSHEGLAKFRRRLLLKAERRMEELAAELQDLGQPLDQRIVAGDPATVLLEQAAALEADLLVICKHARPTTEQLLLGSVTLRVLDDSVCDVLVVQ
ncbi:MAG: universal stress protein [Gammaproteobacteria bacterium]|nr:universal stress protein [Gammaproteobacteria bacterium]